MPLFSGRRNGRPKPRLAPELDDTELGRLVKLLREPPRPGMIATTDLHVSRVSALLTAADKDWDRRSHRFSTLAATVPDARLSATWAAREPRNPDALLLHARVRLEHGLRTGSLTDASSLVESCHRVAELIPDDPGPWTVLLGVARLARHDRRSVLGTWREVLARDRWNREAHLQMLAYLSPSAGGSRMQVLEFVDAVHARMPANAPSAAVELAACVGQYLDTVSLGGVQALMARDYWALPQVRSVLDRALAAWPSPGFFRHAAALADLNLLAYALVCAERPADATTVFRALNGTATPWPWQCEGEPLSVFERRQERCLH
ncbi:hypothetical protein ACFUN7_03130 [Streptomyces sp. NPDC057236]|uniref:hypothetical protein n=1 Tax=Streptomyces sp. NPDC057236 TaxID=3346059 RepID=UPI00363BF807